MNTPSSRNGVSAAHSNGKPSMCGYTPYTAIMPITEATSVPAAIWNAVRFGFGDDDASAQTAAASSVKVAPLGHAVAIQNAPSTIMTMAARKPATPAAIALVFGS
jgi:hypothetical protein